MSDTVKVTVKSEALASVLGVKADSQIDVKCKRGVPVSREWRNRFRDSKIDGCITIHQNAKSKPKACEKEPK